MSKKILAILMAVAMAFSLLPVTALAAGGTQTPANATQPRTSVTTDTEDGVHISKKVEKAADGNYNLVMEAYVEGNTKIVASSKPLDIVLVLDVSGSMDDPMSKKDKTKRIDALKSAVNAFIDNVGQKNTSTDGTAVGHRISIVKFASDKKDDVVGNDTYRSGGFKHNYSQIVENLITVDDAGKEKLTAAVNGLEPAGTTRADYGMELAQSVLPSSDKESNRDKVVVMFTDGIPTSLSKFEYGVASSAIAKSATLKKDNVKVYTIGIFKDADSSEIRGDWNNEYWKNKNNKYMQAVSSNYPTASLVQDRGWKWNPGQRAEGNYYLTATDADGLNKVFQTISNSITTTHVKANANAVLRDTLMDQFVLNGNANDITVKKAKVTGKTGNTYSWGSLEDVDGIEKNVSSDGKTVTVTGFDYTSTGTTGNVITKNGNDYSGYKLIVTIPIKVDKAYEGWRAGKNNYDTNTTGDNNKAGLTGYTKDGEEASTLLNESPQVPVTAYTVTYSWGDNAPSNQTLPTDDRNYIPGQSYTVDSTFANGTNIENASGSYQFSGWTDPNNPNGVMGTKNVTITGSWTHTVPTPPASTYTLTYDANGGEAGSVPTDNNDYTAGQTVNLDYSKAPTHEQKDEKNVIFIGWSATDDNEKIYDKGGKIPDLIQSVTMNDNKTVYAVWGLDKDGDSTPDVFQATVTYKIKNGYWFDSGTDGSDGSVSTDPVTAQFILYEKSGNQWVAKNPTLGNTIPTGRGSDAGYTADGWYKDSKKIDISNTTPVTGDVTYTFKYVKVSTEATWDVSRSKTATPLDTSTWTSNVTLSLPSAEYEPVIDVVFILDDTYAGNGIFKDAATALLNELSEKKNLDVNVGIVNFDAVARDWVAATTNRKYSGLVSLKNTEGLTALQNAIATKLDKKNDGQTKKIGATNIEWPLEMAQNMLASGKGTEKYAILFSDMYGYVYRGDLIIDGQTYENVPLSKRLYTGESKFYQGSLSMGTKYQSFADVYAHRNDEENQTIDGFFRDTSWDDYWNIYSGYTQAPTNPVTKGSEDPFGVSGGYSGFEKSTCLVYDRLLQMKQAGINISIVNNDFAPGTVDEVGYIYSIKNEMLNVLKEKGISVIQTQKDVTAGDMTNVFDTLKDQLIQVVSAGSTVTDKIGTNFDFVGLNTMSLKIGDDTIPGVIDEATNTITFKHGGKDNAHVVVYDSSADSFTWTINEDVTKDARVQLTYSVKLTKPETAAGTYGVTDLNGDGKVDGTDTTYTDTDALYTNESATMVPKDSNGNTGAELTFPKPSVSYKISSGSSGSHSGGSRPSLNTKDHYGYIIGYPVDYYTGQPTTDQTKKPVRPEGKITRAEVATIYFRMLTDESRTKFWSQSSGYSDVKTGDWFNNAVSTLSNAGIIAGYEDGSFRPNGYITRAEFATIAARFFDVTYNGKDLFPDISGHWAKDYINQAANKGFVNGYEDGTFKPDRNITRAEAVTLVNRTLDRHPDKNHFTKDMLVWPDNMDQTKWYYADMQEATNSHTYQMKENSDKSKYENWTKTLPIRNWEALEKAWSNANSSQGNGNVV